MWGEGEGEGERAHWQSKTGNQMPDNLRVPAPFTRAFCWSPPFGPDHYGDENPPDFVTFHSALPPFFVF